MELGRKLMDPSLFPYSFQKRFSGSAVDTFKFWDTLWEQVCQGQILAVWIFAAKLPNSALNFAVDCWVDVSSYFFQGEGPKIIHPKLLCKIHLEICLEKFPLDFCRGLILKVCPSDQSALIDVSLWRNPLWKLCKSSRTRPKDQPSKPLWERKWCNLSRFEQWTGASSLFFFVPQPVSANLPYFASICVNLRLVDVSSR